MTTTSDFADIITICQFYAESGWDIYVDYENSHVMMGDYVIGPVRENGVLVGYLVADPEGVTQVVDDLDSYFQGEFDWEDR